MASMGCVCVVRGAVTGRGGDGGAGANGGHAGGGLGAASIGIAHLNGQLPAALDVAITADSPGKGGLEGNDLVSGSAGGDGTPADTLGFPW